MVSKKIVLVIMIIACLLLISTFWMNSSISKSNNKKANGENLKGSIQFKINPPVSLDNQVIEGDLGNGK